MGWVAPYIGIKISDAVSNTHSTPIQTYGHKGVLFSRITVTFDILERFWSSFFGRPTLRIKNLEVESNLQEHMKPWVLNHVVKTLWGLLRVVFKTRDSITDCEWCFKKRTRTVSRLSLLYYPLLLHCIPVFFFWVRRGGGVTASLLGIAQNP